MAKPILKWAGGKRAMLEEIRPRLPPKSEFNRYFEPFLGGGAVFFDLEPANGYVNDINPRLVNFYRQIKHNPEQIIVHNEKFDKKFASKDEDGREGIYYEIRDEFNDLRDGPEDCEDELREAALLLILNRTCWNGLYRTNEKGEFNVPMGSNHTEISVLEPRIREAYRVLQNTTITNRDFTFVDDLVEEDDLVFFDPPYPSVRKTGSFERYHPGGFDFERHRELRELAIQLDKRGAYVVITNANDRKSDIDKDEFVSDLYLDGDLPESFRITGAKGNRMINSDSTKRTNIGETDIIVTNCSQFDPQRTFEDYR